jgi:two-component system chemotaxis response regulator CheY
MATILAVDDSPSMRRMVAATLEDAGYEVTTASNGRTAVDVARNGRFDFVVTDINMPEMDGIALVRALRLMPQYRSTPVMVLTTEGDTLKEQAKAAGATGWIPKPFNPDNLLAVVRKFLG